MNHIVQIIGIPVDLAQNHRVVDMGPNAIRYAGRLLPLDIIQTNPILDSSNRTAEMAVSSTASLFGKSILY